MKQKLINELYAILYQVGCIPLLTMISLYLYYDFIVVSFANGGFVTIIVTTLLVLFNIAAIYAIAYFVERVLKMPLINHVLTWGVLAFVLVWVNVYYSATTKSTCDGASAIKCSELINSSKLAKTALIACITYSLLYIIIRKIVVKKNQRSNS